MSGLGDRRRVKDEALWLQAKIDADKKGRDIDAVYAEYRVRKLKIDKEGTLFQRIVGGIIFIVIIAFLIKRCNTGSFF